MVGTMDHERVSDRYSLLLDQEEKEDEQNILALLREGP
jgi:hypothetical protein